jgi:phosphatidylinositol glycan class B
VRPRSLCSLRVLLPQGWVATVLVAGVCVHAIAAWDNAGFFGADEHYQIIEFAQYRLGRQAPTGLPWEFAAQVRPAFQPLVAAGAITAWRFVGVRSPFVIAASLRFLSAMLALWAALSLCARCLPGLSNDWLRRIAVLSALFFWVAPLVHGRFSSENWGGALAAAGLCLMLDAVDAWPAHTTAAMQSAVACGLVWSAAFYCRFQVGLMIAGAGLWMLIVRRAPVRLVLLVAAAFVAGSGLNEGFDRWLYGSWGLVPYNYFAVQVVQGRAATFGVSPWWRLALYPAAVLIPPYSIAALGVLLSGVWYARRHVLVWTTLPFIVAHAILGHKEPRFLIPLVYVVGPLFAVCVEALPPPIRGQLLAWPGTPAGRRNVTILCSVNAALLVATLMVPAHELYRLHRWLWDQGRAHPMTLYTIGGSPYDLSGADNSFYRSDAVTLVPIEAAGELVSALRNRPGTPQFVYYRGLETPPLLARAAVGCLPVLRTFPAWLPRIDYFNWLADAQLATICRPAAPISAGGGQ